MEFEKGDVITFVLTLFSTALAIIPMVEPINNSPPHNPELNSIVTILNKEASGDDKALAYNMMHDINGINRYLLDINSNITNAVLKYDNKELKNQTILNSGTELAKLAHNLTLSKELTNEEKKIWLTYREFQIENDGEFQFINGTKNINWNEDKACKGDKCSSGELQNMSSYLETMANSGFKDNFFVSSKKVNQLQNPLEDFVFSINRGIVISLLSVPVVFYLTIRLL